MPVLQKWFEREEKKDLQKNWLGLKEILIATLSAQIAVLPLLVINFGQLSIIAPLANLAVLSFIPITMLFGFLSALGGLIFLPLGNILGWLAWLFLTYEIKIIELLAKIPLAAVKFKWTWLGGGIYYAILIWAVWQLNKKQKTDVAKN
jgi:competence protein ComEC